VTARLLDGNALSRQLNQALRQRVLALPFTPGLAVVLVGSDPASQVYVSRKGVVAGRVGFLHRQIDLPAETTQERLLEVVAELNGDEAIDGILVQFPLPAHLDAHAVLDAIAPEKDCDGLSAVNLGRLTQGRPGLVACTPKGVMRLIAESGLNPSGRHAVVLGRSNIVGRPMALLLEQANATVTVCHSRTPDVAEVVRRSDLVVAAVGIPELVRGDWLKPGAVVIDVGVNRLADGRLVGDVAFDEAVEVASAVTPVPGGVGPMTIAMLMENTCEAAVARRR
jgi:methylenetetrahydrofolate dehydrogenase (NADP+)/methenyltetrahydrofolate cyclohydrolase